MRFSQKMTLSITVLLAVLISIGGTLLTRASFQSSLKSTITQSTAQHQLEKYAVEADLLGVITDGGITGIEHLRRHADSIAGYFSGNERLFALYTQDSREVYSNLPENISLGDRNDALGAGSDACIMRGQYLLMASRIDTPYQAVWLLSAFDVSGIFQERSEQLKYLLQIEVVLVGLGVVLTAVMSMMLTRNIKKLSRTAHSIAMGAYGRRAGLKTRDEIGSLARDFDYMAQAVQENVEELKAGIQSRDDFIAAFSHEMKTPMTALVGYSGILRTAEEEPEVRRMAANHIFNEARRLETLSQQLLKLMGLSDETVEMQAVSFKDIYEETLSPLGQNISRIEVFGNMDCIVLADLSLCADLLFNLVSNALQSSAGVVKIHLRQGKNRLRILISDEGHGISGQDIKRITEPFYMVDKSRSRKHGGSGIGLALALKIAEFHGGSLRYASRVGKGTVVRFSLDLESGGAGA